MSCDCWPKSAAKPALPVQEQSLVERLTEHDVRLWHLADISAAAAFVRFRTTADKGGFWPAMVCPLMTHKRHCSEPHVCCRLISEKFHARFRERSPYES